MKILKTVTVQIGLDDEVHDKLPQSSVDAMSKELDRVLTPNFVGGIANHLFQTAQLRALRVNGIVMSVAQTENQDLSEPVPVQP